MALSNAPKHSKSDIIWSALAYQYATQTFTDFPYSSIVREKVDALFSQIGEGLKHVHTDSRRSIHEHNGSDFSIQSFEVHSANIPLGNHYHRKSVWHMESDGTDLWQLSELFVFDKGSGILLLQKLSPEGDAISNVEEFNLRANDILVLSPLVAHTLYLEPGTKFRWFRPYPFDSSDMDMNPYKLELPVR